MDQSLDVIFKSNSVLLTKNWFDWKTGSFSTPGWGACMGAEIYKFMV